MTAWFVSIRPKKILLATPAPPRVCFYCCIDRFYIGKKKKLVSVSGHFRNFFQSAQVRSVSLLIAIIVSKAFMSKACIMSFWVIQWISYFENTAFEPTMIITKKKKKKVHPCLIKNFGNWPEKLIFFLFGHIYIYIYIYFFFFFLLKPSFS